ncbi:hypothetical protein [Hymenobacter rigui]|uniref:SIR2-like domain-containing protein n=1 Tax=Hymenobacter rigui TaxID=334424 RepID=A0A3R9P3X4_9BACT|nr:hypothetical protein [Hymenobacter rigui]RSK43753.1 hypothetical protein EI291_21845 [Hymenobacter rigui]
MKYFGRTYKTIGNFINNEPVMVFNQPESKGHIIKNDNVLNEYFRYLKLLLKSENTSRLVILGNSMEAEPHLKAVIKEYFNRPNTEIIVSSRAPHKVSNELKEYYDYDIKQIAVGEINTEEGIINLFKDYLTLSELKRNK